MDSGDEKQEAQNEDSPDPRQGGWVQSDPDGGESDRRQSRGRDEADPERRGRVCDNTTKGAEKKRKAGELWSMRGGGRHKDKKRKSEKTQTTSPERPEQKRDGESRSDEGPEMIPMDEALRWLEENEGYQEIVESVSEGSEGEVEQKVQKYLAYIQQVSWMNKEQFKHLEGRVRWAVEARIQGRCEEQEQSRQQ